MIKINIELSNKLAAAEISLCHGPEGPFRISRFPRSLLQDEDLSQSKPLEAISVELTLVANNLFPFTETRQHLVVNSSRWAGRISSQQLWRKLWVLFDLTQVGHDVALSGPEFRYRRLISQQTETGSSSTSRWPKPSANAGGIPWARYTKGLGREHKTEICTS